MKKIIECLNKELIKCNKSNDVPVAAVIVRNDKIIAKAHNKRYHNGNVLDHAEIIAIKKAAKKINDWRLSECIMYVTLEPCKMCEQIINASRISEVHYFTKNMNKEKEDIANNCAYIKISDENSIAYEKKLKDFFKNRRN